ncbi:MAG: GDP-L-fucose synthase [Candidatus Deianiraeaceae bacterium]|jgi:GDP-L-fucose synthase
MGDGTPKREWTFAQDIADSIINLLTVNVSHSMINVGTGVDISMINLAKTIMKVVDYECDIKVQGGSKMNVMQRKIVDVSLAKSYGVICNTSLEGGIKRTYDWFLKNIS